VKPITRGVVGASVAAAFCLWPSSCLDFTQCRWCADSGCPTANLWRKELSFDSEITACSSLNSGFDDAGGLGSAMCALLDSGHWGIGTMPLSENPGTSLCARVVLEQTPNGGLDVGLECNGCDSSKHTCACFQEADAGCRAATSATPACGPIVVGPFQVPVAQCNTGVLVDFVSRFTDGGSLQFSNGWLWKTTADGGCTWNDMTECPGD
jgi:hypothetical protein